VDGCIPAETISRLHARIIKEGDLYFLEDLNSTNGTWAEQMQLDPYELFPVEDGMRVTFASAEYEVKIGK
jgi:pSer/pThr/pTyr-binding forkhead associated (FHA) protein